MLNAHSTLVIRGEYPTYTGRLMATSILLLQRRKPQDSTLMWNSRFVNEKMSTDCSKNDGRITLAKMVVRDSLKIASNLDINMTKLVTNQMKHGWAGKEKDFLQVLWECGWINE